MLNNQVFYSGTIRKTIVAFGSLFSNIYIDRKQGNSVSGPTIQRLQIPLAYSGKEKWIQRLDGDPNLENNTYTTLPRMAFEITGYTYDASRKINKMQRITSCTESASAITLQSPVPYNIDITLYILTKTQEDGLQIIEQILPTFQPEYTLSINLIPEMGIVQDIPIILNNISVQDEYDGDFQTRRFVTHTLSFTLKVNLFGGITSKKTITNVGGTMVDGDISTGGINIKKKDSDETYAVYTAVGDPITETVVFEDWVEEL
jgi:hypothetical protein